MRTTLHIKAAIFIAAFLFACNSKYTSDELVSLGQVSDSLSVEIAEDVEMVYSDSAILRARIWAPVMERFPKKEEPYVEMKEGVRARFFDLSGRESSNLVANYAINYEKKGVIIMRDSVRVVNKYDEEIKTDELIWDENERRIHSDKKVRVRQGNEKILVGEGFESNEGFTKYRIRKLTGVIQLEEQNSEHEEEE